MSKHLISILEIVKFCNSHTQKEKTVHMIVVEKGKRKRKWKRGGEGGGRKYGGRLTVLSCPKEKKVHCSTRDYTCCILAKPTMVITEYKIR